MTPELAHSLAMFLDTLSYAIALGGVVVVVALVWVWLT